MALTQRTELAGVHVLTGLTRPQKNARIDLLETGFDLWGVSWGSWWVFETSFQWMNPSVRSALHWALMVFLLSCLYVILLCKALDDFF